MPVYRFSRATRARNFATIHVSPSSSLSVNVRLVRSNCLGPAWQIPEHLDGCHLAVGRSPQYSSLDDIRETSPDSGGIREHFEYLCFLTALSRVSSCFSRYFAVQEYPLRPWNWIFHLQARRSWETGPSRSVCYESAHRRRYNKSHKALELRIPRLHTRSCTTTRLRSELYPARSPGDTRECFPGHRHFSRQPGLLRRSREAQIHYCKGSCARRVRSSTSSHTRFFSTTISCRGATSARNHK